MAITVVLGLVIVGVVLVPIIDSAASGGGNGGGNGGGGSGGDAAVGYPMWNYSEGIESIYTLYCSEFDQHPVVEITGQDIASMESLSCNIIWDAGKIMIDVYPDDEEMEFAIYDADSSAYYMIDYANLSSIRISIGTDDTLSIQFYGKDEDTNQVGSYSFNWSAQFIEIRDWIPDVMTDGYVSTMYGYSNWSRNYYVDVGTKIWVIETDPETNFYTCLGVFDYNGEETINTNLNVGGVPVVLNFEIVDSLHSRLLVDWNYDNFSGDVMIANTYHSEMPSNVRLSRITENVQFTTYQAFDYHIDLGNDIIQTSIYPGIVTAQNIDEAKLYNNYILAMGVDWIIAVVVFEHEDEWDPLYRTEFVAILGNDVYCSSGDANNHWNVTITTTGSVSLTNGITYQSSSTECYVPDPNGEYLSVTSTEYDTSYYASAELSISDYPYSSDPTLDYVNIDMTGPLTSMGNQDFTVYISGIPAITTSAASASAARSVSDSEPTNGGVSNTLLMIVPVFLALGILMYAVQYLRDGRNGL